MKSAKEINELQRTSGKPFWHRGYYEHVIRDGRDLDRIRKYILENPLNWNSDDEHPRNIRMDCVHNSAEDWSALD
jgi:hypothetical protein